jgi:hypothetical protein
MEYKLQLVDMSKIILIGGSVIKNIGHFKLSNNNSKYTDTIIFHNISDELKLNLLRQSEENNYDYNLDIRNDEIILNEMKHYEENRYDYDLQLN